MILNNLLRGGVRQLWTPDLGSGMKRGQHTSPRLINKCINMDTITISNYKQLLIKEKKLVKYCQQIVFDYNNVVCKYEVRSDFLCCQSDMLNCKIFDLLELDKNQFCTKHYGYRPTGGDFPVCKKDDYEALTRVIVALFQEIESRTKEPSKEEISVEEIKESPFKLNISLIDSKVTIRI